MIPNLISILLSTSAFAGPFVTIEYSPLSRGDVVWSAEQQTSGLVVGEFDGFVNPSLKTHVGVWATKNIGATASVGVARIQNTSWFEEDVFHQSHIGVIRPAFDLRFAPFEPMEKLPRIWLSVGAYLDVASSRDVSNGYTETEQEQANQIATEQSNRLRGSGSRLGFGIEKVLLPGFAVGMTSGLIFHRATTLTETSQTTSGWTYGDTSLLLTFYWPSETEVPEPSDQRPEGIYTPDKLKSSPN